MTTLSIIWNAAVPCAFPAVFWQATRGSAGGKHRVAREAAGRCASAVERFTDRLGL